MRSVMAVIYTALLSVGFVAGSDARTDRHKTVTPGAVTSGTYTFGRVEYLSAPSSFDVGGHGIFTNVVDAGSASFSTAKTGCIETTFSAVNTGTDPYTVVRVVLDGAQECAPGEIYMNADGTAYYTENFVCLAVPSGQHSVQVQFECGASCAVLGRELEVHHRP